MLAIYLRFFGVIILLVAILNALWYSFGIEVAFGILSGLILFDIYIDALIEKLKGNK